MSDLLHHRDPARLVHLGSGLLAGVLSLLPAATFERILVVTTPRLQPALSPILADGRRLTSSSARVPACPAPARRPVRNVLRTEEPATASGAIALRTRIATSLSELGVEERQLDEVIRDLTDDDRQLVAGVLSSAH